MRTPDDAIRSIKRYMAEALGEEWEVRLWSDEGAFSYPFARVTESAPTSYGPHRRVFTDITQAVQIHCYPSKAASMSAAQSLGRQVEQQVVRAIEVGVGAVAWPRRIPLYDYDGLDDSEGSNSRETYDFLKVTNFTCNRVPDSDDQALVVVVADLRVSWAQRTEIVVETLPVNSVRVDERVS